MGTHHYHDSIVCQPIYTLNIKWAEEESWFLYSSHTAFMYVSLYCPGYVSLCTKGWWMLFDCKIFCWIIYISMYKLLLHTAAILYELSEQQSKTSSLLVIQKQENIINSKWVWSGNTIITNRRQTIGSARKSHRIITRHPKAKPI